MGAQYKLVEWRNKCGLAWAGEPCSGGMLPELFQSPPAFLLGTTLPRAPCQGLLAPLESEEGASLLSGPPASSAPGVSLWALLNPAPGMASSSLCCSLKFHLAVKAWISMSSICHLLPQESTQMAIWEFTKAVEGRESQCLGADVAR